MKKLLYGVAYYDEYMPYDRLEEDVRMMKKAKINLVRIAESTWSTWEPQDGVYDFYHLDRVLDAMEEAGISVIVGTPTYAFPTWLAKAHPQVLAQTKDGTQRYGHRQNMDILSPAYRFYAERIIRKIAERTAKRACVIGYQADNETKHYDTSAPHVQQLFIKALKEEFGTTEAMNEAFGLSYWSNRINSWEDFPDVLGTINGSLYAAFEKFKRGLVSEYLAWQAGILREYSREDQFITHNFDFEWRGISYGVQPDVDHYQAAKALDVAGCDIYHPTQEKLSGIESAFGGDITRSLKGKNYFVLETEAQGFAQWVSFDGQLRLQAFSHVAGGANLVEYWHWHSIHNSFETYWKGVLSHDLKENRTYREVCSIGADFDRLGEKLVNLQKKNRAAILISNESLSAIDAFPIGAGGDGVDYSSGKHYNDVFRWCYDALYRMNIETDILFPENVRERARDYELIVVPALYSAPEEVLAALRDFVAAGGRLAVSFKSGFTNEQVKVYTHEQPSILSDCLGIRYDQFTVPRDGKIKGLGLTGEAAKIHDWMELVETRGAKVLASYDHRHWGAYAAITLNAYGEGKALYLGAFASDEAIERALAVLLEGSTLCQKERIHHFPIIIKKGVNEAGNQIVYYFNYSDEARMVRYVHENGRELISGEAMESGKEKKLDAWGFWVVESGKDK